jgi:cation diffusion facilitator family transporter
MVTAAPSAARSETRAILFALIVSIVLMLIKFAAYLVTGSTAIFSDALESIVNVVASCFALFAIVLAHRPADTTHPYGHGKVEFLAAGFEGGMMLVAVVVILVRAIEAMIYGPRIEQIVLGLVMVGGAMLINGGLGIYLVRRGRWHGSITLEADGRHLISDAVTSAAVLGALVIVGMTGWTYADPIAAMMVAGYIVYVAVGLLRRAWAGLMDAQDIEDERLLQRILDSHIGPDGQEPRICSYHKLRHRHSGRYHWVDFHIMVPASWDVARGHETASRIEYEIEQALGEGNATAHVEPCVDGGCRVCRI